MTEEPISFEPTPEPTSLTIADSDLKTLESAAKWARLLAIIGFVGLGLMVVLAFSMGSLMAVFMPPGMDLPVPVAFYAAVYLFFAIVYFFPVLYLFNFARNTQQAIREMSQPKLTSALQSLNAHYRFIGILMLILMGLYGVLLLFGILGALLAGVTG